MTSAHQHILFMELNVAASSLLPSAVQ